MNRYKSLFRLHKDNILLWKHQLHYIYHNNRAKSNFELLLECNLYSSDSDVNTDFQYVI